MAVDAADFRCAGPDDPGATVGEAVLLNGRRPDWTSTGSLRCYPRPTPPAPGISGPPITALYFLRAYDRLRVLYTVLS